MSIGLRSQFMGCETPHGESTTSTDPVFKEDWARGCGVGKKKEHNLSGRTQLLHIKEASNKRYQQVK